MAIPDPLDLYCSMLQIRNTEEQLARAYRNGEIMGACHTYVGQEAVAVGICAHLTPKDAVFSTHRGHGHALAKGVPAQAVAAELFGRATGTSGGRGGSMHLFAPEVGMMGTTGIVGPNILQATGAAYAFQLLEKDEVAVAFFGDGAVNNGAFHEGLNLAAIWGLPVLFVCENNLYATEIAFSYAAGNPEVANRAAAYGLPGTAIDGNDVMTVCETAGTMIDQARQGGGPSLLECKTYRTRAHAEGMPEVGYRSRQEVDAWKRKDPIARQRAYLLTHGLAASDSLDTLEAASVQAAADAMEFARTSSWPDPGTATENVYAET